MSYNFFAYLSRMKYIKRWSLMRSVSEENLLEHTAMTTMLTHSLALIANKVYKKEVDIKRALEISLYHDSCEVLIGDLPTPVKYFNREISSAYKKLENISNNKLLSMLPSELSDEMKDILILEETTYEQKLVKAADSLAAYIKCVEETKCGNKEYKKALVSLERRMKEKHLEEVDYFLKNFMDGFSLSLDELE